MLGPNSDTNNNVIQHSDKTITYMNTTVKCMDNNKEQGQLAIQTRIKIQQQGFVPDTVYVLILHSLWREKRRKDHD